ncbi:MAG TPA: prepilin-type N-terminal cleavage/methylation domain-containing protein [Gemmatimonadaceae bacterium]|nr:prepilin-type N-terminal cleavage/methylation domain-containing protein [Gemmatimonadaceae bacterium]
MTHSRIRRARRGFTIIELLVGIVIFAIVGTLFTKLLTVQGRFFDRQGMGNAARNVSRASLNRVVSDFRMIEATGGVLAATPTSLTIRIPYAIGVVCKNSAIGGTVLSLLPVDSTTYAEADFYGYAWRNFQTGVYAYVENPAAKFDGDPADCVAMNITTVPNGKTVRITPTVPANAGLGTPVFLYGRVRYEFKASNAVPGKLGLYRTSLLTNGSEESEELVAPFANTAHWKFFTVNGGAVAQDAAPANLADMRGLELHLDGTSETIAAGQVSAEQAPFTTAVFFKNRTN